MPASMWSWTRATSITWPSAPPAAGRGLADRLLDVFCRFGQAHLAFLTLEVRPSNTAAVALYEKHGFQEAGRRKVTMKPPGRTPCC